MISHQTLNVVLALSTCKSLEQAEKLTNEIMEEQLAACVTAIPGAVSTYWWESRLERSQEVVLLIKTTKEQLGKIDELFYRSHPYELPELVCIEPAAGSEAYLSWVRQLSNSFSR